MSDAELLSHFEPTLRLPQHLAQVRAAGEFLLAGHSLRVRTQRPETAIVLSALVRGHDLGKGSLAFQDYIADPARYRGEAHAKEHSTLSAALMLLWAKAQGWDALPALALTQAIAGHHVGFATLDYLEDRLILEEGDALLEQWASLDRQALGRASGLDLAATEGDFEDARRWLFRRQRVGERLQALPLAEAVGFRLWSQFLFALLLESDKAFLALREEQLRRYFQQPRPQLAPECVDARLAGLPETPLNRLRDELRTQILTTTDAEHPCCTLTLPTGTGKTLLAATWALAQRARLAEDGPPPRIIIALPFLSIVDQTEQEYRTLLGLDPAGCAQSDRLLASHSLSHAEYEVEGAALGSAYTRFYLDTWRSEIIVTTFDQLLLALCSPKTRHQMRFHALMDALIVLDEVQTLPCRLWDLVDHALRGLCAESTTRVLLMSATQPALLTGARELAGDGARVAAIFGQFRRYRLRFRHRERQDLNGFIQALVPRLTEWRAQGRRVLITLNTRASAKAVWRAVSAQFPDIPVWLISADVTPRDRLKKIAAIKALRPGEPGIVVSTQTIEAGVDIDMDIVIRDFAPLDALIQVAGRCNRHNRLGDQGGEVEIVSLSSPKGREYAGIIYDQVLLDATREVLAEQPEALGEDAVLDLSRRYFDLIRSRKNTGAELTEAFARWGELPDIQSLLRGKTGEQTSFLALAEDEDWLRLALECALAVPDRWERREALRALAADIQQRTVTVYTRRGFHPEDYADPIGYFWRLRSGYYQPDTGLELGLDDEDPATCIL
ncbi:CRISPR-associated helicase Cas3' [Marichromatium sp. AB31]|uniref:CRISPR-associated helicase Cas3' n=1 Tax=Marichromatium sp. AB31 TaxID=2483362 RepID=UPI000F3D4DD9|nr:CRISPR-associated helicase Cas3' [Marichromatium sp. AB31]RNE91170.1 CRISPR-associated helicase Cas3' [Marichromatium sp. AB31]